MKTYKAFRQFIERDVETEGGGNTNELYRLEGAIHVAINEVVKWREKNLKEKYWEEALPQTLLTILEGYDLNAGEVAAKCFLQVPERSYGEGVEKTDLDKIDGNKK